VTVFVLQVKYKQKHFINKTPVTQNSKNHKNEIRNGVFNMTYTYKLKTAR